MPTLMASPYLTGLLPGMVATAAEPTALMTPTTLISPQKRTDRLEVSGPRHLEKVCAVCSIRNQMIVKSKCPSAANWSTISFLPKSGCRAQITQIENLQLPVDLSAVTCHLVQQFST